MGPRAQRQSPDYYRGVRHGEGHATITFWAFVIVAFLVGVLLGSSF